MKILFTMLSLSVKGDMYLTASKNLINEILSNTQHDVLLTTNNVEFFDDVKNSRLLVRNNVPEDSILNYRNGVEFNYNLKYLAFKNIPEGYDVIFYVDGDIKNTFWNQVSEDNIKSLMITYDWVATRLNCVLKDEVERYKNTGGCLFSHKIKSYNILDWDVNDKLMESRLPSEHFLIFKYNKEKLDMFSNKWSELNSIMQSQNGGNGSWGDGFEIGISAKYAGYDNMVDLHSGDLQNHFGFVFNGNKK
jgi:hypothetical protein